MARFVRSALLALFCFPCLGRADEPAALFHAISLTPKPLHVGTFDLQERSGDRFTPEQLRGKVWVVHFFFTTCPGPCVKTMPQMQRLQKVFAGKADVALVSITVRPEHDAKLLRDYADAKGADPEQWLFLSGPEPAVHKIIRECFRQAVDKTPNASDPSNDVTHTPHLLLIDRDGNIRGYIDGQDPVAVDALITQIRSLAGQKYALPAINAGLNGLCALLLVAGYIAIRRRCEGLHIGCMLAALCVSALFLTSYLYFHFAIQAGQPTRFRGEGWVAFSYFAILLSHTALALVVAPLALYVAYQGLRNHRPRHVRIARWTLPLWLYVSITGVVVYWMLYQLYPPY
jgi:protein SCO1/2/putative membrane protein